VFKKLLLLGFVLISSLWIWKIFNFNFLLGSVVVLTSIFLWLGLLTSKNSYYYLYVLFFIPLVFFQWKTSFKTPITYLNENEKLIQRIRLNAYPPFSLKIGGKTIWIPIAHWLEQRKEAILFYKLEENFSEVVDPNLYFFANHPRERVGVVEFEKFPYILLPTFLLGIFSIKKRNLKYILLGLSPIILISFIGNSNPIGPFALFPFFATVISLGLLPIFSKKIFLVTGLVAFVLVFIQVFAYATY